MKQTLISICLLTGLFIAVGCSSKDHGQKDHGDRPLIHGSAVGIRRPVPVILDENCPAIYEARLIKPSHNYKKLDWDSYAVFGDLPIVNSIRHDSTNPAQKMTIWRTKEATYLAIVTRLGWVRTFFSYSDGIFLRDCYTGEKYPIIEVVNFPFNQDFFIEGVPGDHIYMLLKFQPLPESTRYIDYYEPYVSQDYAVEYNRLSIATLEANHHLITPAKRKIVY